MKTELTVSAKVGWLCLSILAMPLLSAYAQSGRTVQPSPTPLPEAMSPMRPDAKSQFVVDPSAAEYKLVFPTSYEGTSLTVGKQAADQGRHSRLTNFVEQLNKAGAQGYRLLSVTSGWNPNGIVKLDEAQYEYAWFETTSNFFYSKSGFAEKYAELAKRGFRMVEHFHLGSSCENKGEISYDKNGQIEPINPLYEVCEYKDLFLLEREKGVEGSVQHLLAVGSPGWRAKMGEMLTTQIAEKWKEGLYPTHAFSKFEILLQQPAKTDEPLTDQPEVQVVTTPNWKRGGVQKRINELAGQGFRLAFVNEGIGVMYRNRETTTPVSYIWLDAKNNFDKQLAQLQASGAVYRMTYPDKRGKENKLIFEQSIIIGGNRREYRVLKFKFQEVEKAAEGKVQIELAPSSKEAVKELNRLAKEGYKVRDVFLANEVSVLLER